MKKKIFIFLLVAISLRSWAQLCYNKNQLITIQDNALMYVMGSYENDSTANLQNSGRLYLDSSFINYHNSLSEKSGKYYLKGDWINSASFVPDSSKVYLWSAHQFIKGSSVTTFYDLLCQGTGPKELNINANVLDSLVFTSLEIKTNNDTLFFENTSAAALKYDSTFAAEGYISNDTLGALSRKISAIGWYIYPMGNNNSGSSFYRPLVLKNSPGNLATSTVAVSFNHYNATVKGYNTNLKDVSLCKVDSDFYHEVKAWSNKEYDIKYYFYKPSDHNWNTIGNWSSGNNNWKEINNSLPAYGSNGYYNYIQKDSFIINQYLPVALANRYPVVSSIFGKDTGCIKGSIKLSTIVNPSSDYEFYWTSTGSHQFSSNDSTHLNASINYNSPGNYVVSFTLLDTAFGCANISKTTNVFIDQGPHAGFNVLTNPIYNGIPVSIQDSSSGALTWLYNLGNGQTSNQANPQVVYFTDGNITIVQIVTDKYGCKDSLAKIMVIGDGIIIPNVFTPNADGTNDLFIIKGGGIKNYNIEIITRWGETVFKGSDQTAGWDGTTVAGVQCSEGTYYYILSVNYMTPEIKEYKGFFTLLR